MTVLIGASVLLIAGSAIALVFGWAGADQSLIWTSIAATAAAAVTLSLAYVRSRTAPAPTRRSPEREPEPEAKRQDAEPAADPASERETVVAIVSTKKFHRPDCRYAGAAGGERMTKGAARRADYAPCAVCKP